jgi:prophage maintenance system killer protein
LPSARPRILRTLAGVLSIGTPKTFAAWPIARPPETFRYIDFAAAADIVAGARARAAEIGDPRLAPPFALERCDRATIEAALASPRTGFGGEEKYPDLATKAAALLYAFAKIQSCPEGNKRLALLVVDAFVTLNDAQLETQPGELADMILAAAESAPRERDAVRGRIAEWMITRLSPLRQEDA